MFPYTKFEKNYDFLARHFLVFVPHRRLPERQAGEGEVCLDDSWRIVLPAQTCALQERAAADLQEYLHVSQDLDLPIMRQTEEGTEAPPPHAIRFLSAEDGVDGFTVTVSSEDISVICAPASHLEAAVFLEDQMNFAEGPVLSLGNHRRERLIRVKEVHSACGDDAYPDEELNAIAHAGYNCIVVFMTAPDRDRHGPCDLPTLIRRAAAYGLKVTAYSYLSCWKHPDEPHAQEAFDAVFGDFVRRNPGLHRIKLVGESLEFPSRDPRTTGKRFTESLQDGIPDPRPSPGWFPCSDYPAYLACIEKAIHAVDPAVEVVMSTYNWGYLPADERRAFVEQLPEGICLELVYDIFGKRSLGDLKMPLMDYSYAMAEPSDFFRTEGENAQNSGRPAHYANVNTAGTSWDVGCVPYMPVPYRLLARLNFLEKARLEWGLNEHYCCHHQGWSDSFANDLSKALEWAPRLETHKAQEEFLRKIAIRDYGQEAAEAVMNAWRLWSDAMEFYVGSNEDQYGPWRVGAAYPFIFQPDISRAFTPKEIQFPTATTAVNGGNTIIKTLYHPYENTEQSPGFLRYPAEIQSLQRMLGLWDKGLEGLSRCACVESRPFQRDALERLYALGHFIRCAIATTIHIKEWWLWNMRLQTSETRAAALNVLDEIEALAKREMENARAAIPDVERDSRLGWEPSMEYVADKWHIEWKLRQVESALREIKAYRGIVNL